MIQVEIRGAENFTAFATRCARAGADLPGDLRKTIEREVDPFRSAVERSARNLLPRRGGLGANVARTQVTSQARGQMSVRMTGTHQYNLLAIDAGTVHHPTYGHQPIVAQSVPAGFWRSAAESMVPRLERGLQKAIHDMAKKIGRG